LVVLRRRVDTSEASILVCTFSLLLSARRGLETEEETMISSQPWHIEKPMASRPGFPTTLLSVVNRRLLRSLPASFWWTLSLATVSEIARIYGKVDC
jgi:hypothetical protein